MENQETEVYPKHYESEYAIKMLPLIIVYCRDIEELFKEYTELSILHNKLQGTIVIDDRSQNKITDKQKDIGEQMDLLLEKVKRWRDELRKMQVGVCSVKLGRLNIPIFDNTTQKVILLCVHKDSKYNMLEWHSIQDTHEQAHPFFHKYNEYKGLLLPNPSEKSISK